MKFRAVIETDLARDGVYGLHVVGAASARHHHIVITELSAVQVRAVVPLVIEGNVLLQFALCVVPDLQGVGGHPGPGQDLHFLKQQPCHSVVGWIIGTVNHVHVRFTAYSTLTGSSQSLNKSQTKAKTGKIFCICDQNLEEFEVCYEMSLSKVKHDA